MAESPPGGVTATMADQWLVLNVTAPPLHLAGIISPRPPVDRLTRISGCCMRTLTHRRFPEEVHQAPNLRQVKCAGVRRPFVSYPRYGLVLSTLGDHCNRVRDY
jgi:hypothetical protein